jgi:hypothetical protein
MSNNMNYTLYSGAHKGAESEFGRQAEKWGVKEINYTFPDHQMERDVNTVALSPEELAKGDVSMEIVSKKLGRRYHQVEKIRNVIQSIFHMVNNGHQVFAIGWIQPDGTVKGGTGWGVELAKIFNRPLSVFDQEKNNWYSWTENQWTESTPRIVHDTFVGTGTRNLTDEGKKAIEELFRLSFGN